MATALDPIEDWNPARRVLTAADTLYSVALPRATQRVTVFVEGSDDARYRVTDGDVGATDDWMTMPAGAMTTVRMSDASHGSTRVLYLGTGGTSVAVRILPEATQEM